MLKFIKKGWRVSSCLFLLTFFVPFAICFYVCRSILNEIKAVRIERAYPVQKGDVDEISRRFQES